MNNSKTAARRFLLVGLMSTLLIAMGGSGQSGDAPNPIKPDRLTGLGTFDERMLILLDIDKLMNRNDLGLIAEISH